MPESAQGPMSDCLERTKLRLRRRDRSLLHCFPLARPPFWLSSDTRQESGMHAPVSGPTLVVTGSRERQGEAYPPSHGPPGTDEGGRGRNVAGKRRGI